MGHDHTNSTPFPAISVKNDSTQLCGSRTELVTSWGNLPPGAIYGAVCGGMIIRVPSMIVMIIVKMSDDTSARG